MLSNAQIDQMQPLTDDDNKMDMYDDSITLSASGTVASRSIETCSFMMQTTQFVCGQQEEIAVRARMDKNPKWKRPLDLLPDEKAIIAFDSTLDRFEHYTPPNSKNTIICAVVNVEDITFLLTPEESTSTPQQKSIRDRLKTRRQKRAPSKTASIPSSPEQTQTSSTPSKKGSVLGKRKTETFEKEAAL
jgi:hypothetical protein